MSTVPIIHAVTTDDIVVRADFITLAISVMRALGPRGAVHLRGVAAGGRRLYELASALVAHQETTGAWVVINDRVDAALCVGARGVQLTSRSLLFGDAREVINAAAPGTPRPAVGISVHTVEEARASARVPTTGVAAGAPTWLVAGHVFATPSHAGEPPRGPSSLAEICAAVSLPVIAIGGVRPADMSGLLAAGAYGVAVIRGIWQGVDAEGAARDYLSAYDAVRDAPALGRGGSGARS